MKVLFVSALVLALACLVAGRSPPVEDWQLNRPAVCPKSTFTRDCAMIGGNCRFDSDCRSNAACCDQWGCGFGRCTRKDQPMYDWQKNRPAVCPRSQMPAPGSCSQLTNTCDYDWECERQDGQAVSCCDQWGCNIGRCTNSF